MHIIFSCVPTCAVLRSMIRFFSVYDLYFSISSPVLWTGAHLDDRRSSSDSLSHPPGPRLALIVPSSLFRFSLFPSLSFSSSFLELHRVLLSFDRSRLPSSLKS